MTGSLIAAGSSLYVLSPKAVEKIAPKSGATRALASYVGQPVGSLALVGRQLWLPGVEHGHLVVERYTLALKPLSTVTVAANEPSGLDPVSVTHDVGPYFYLADEMHLYSIDTATAKVKKLLAAPRDIAALATPAGSGDGVVATVQSASGRGGGVVETLSPTGQVLRVDQRFGAPGSGSATGGTPSAGTGALAATRTGIWIEVSTGIAAQFQFIRPGPTAGTPAYGVPSPSTVTVTGKMSWVGLLGTLTCLSSATGKTLASTHVNGSESSIGAVASEHGRTYALWRANDQVSVIQFVSPKSCAG